MKKFTTVSVLITALALTGCTGQTSAENTQQTEISSKAPMQSGPEPSSTSLSVTDDESVKADAIKSGRPEAAWDKDCVAWNLTDPIDEEHEWANNLGQTWLEARNAECPDQIQYPHYFVEEFQPGNNNELVVVVDASLNEVASGAEHKGEVIDWKHIAENVFDGAEKSDPDLKTVTAVANDGSHRYTATLKELQRARKDALPGSMP